MPHKKRYTQKLPFCTGDWRHCLNKIVIPLSKYTQNGLQYAKILCNSTPQYACKQKETAQ